MNFAYLAYDRTGKQFKSTVDAGSVAEAQEALRRQGLFPTELNRLDSDGERAGVQGRLGFAGGGGKARRLKDMSIFVRQLSVLVSTGTPMVEAIISLEKQLPPGPWHKAVSDIRGRLEQGASLTSAMEHHPRYFDAVARSLVAAGESGGRLDDMLKRLAMLSRQQIRIIGAIRGAMVYPCLLLIIATNVLATMLLFVLPRFEGLFKSLGAPLPASTQMLVDLSNLLRGYWWAAILAVIPTIVMMRLWLLSESGRNWVAGLKVTAPQIGKVYRSFATARFARILAVLLEGKVPLLDALKLTRESTGNIRYERLIAKAEEGVTRGESLSSTLQNSPLMSPAVVEAIRSGERSGQLAPVLMHVAEFMDEDNELVLKSLSSLIEPLILLALGVVIGFVAVSMFLPLFDIATAAQAGGGH